MSGRGLSKQNKTEQAIGVRSLQQFPTESVQYNFYNLIKNIENPDLNQQSVAKDIASALLGAASENQTILFQKEIDNVLEEAKAVVDDPLADQAVVAAVSNTSMMNFSLLGSQDGYGPSGMAFGDVPGFIAINGSLEEKKGKGYSRDSLRQLVVHELVHQTQPLAESFFSDEAMARNQLAIVEGVTQIWTSRKLEASGYNPWSDDVLGNEQHGKYLGYRWLVEEAIIQSGVSPDNNKGMLDASRQLISQSSGASEYWIGEQLFPELEPGDRRVALVEVVDTIGENFDELNSKNKNPEDLRTWIQKAIRDQA